MLIEVWYFFAESFTLWLHVLLVSERLFALNWPFLARHMGNAKNAIGLICVAITFCLLLQVEKLEQNKQWML